MTKTHENREFLVSFCIFLIFQIGFKPYIFLVYPCCELLYAHLRFALVEFLMECFSLTSLSMGNRRINILLLLLPNLQAKRGITLLALD